MELSYRHICVVVLDEQNKKEGHSLIQITVIQDNHSDVYILDVFKCNI